MLPEGQYELECFLCGGSGDCIVSVEIMENRRTVNVVIRSQSVLFWCVWVGWFLGRGGGLSFLLRLSLSRSHLDNELRI